MDNSVSYIMSKTADTIRVSGYINPETEPELARIYNILEKSYKPAALVKEGLRCIARREGILTTEGVIAA